MNVTGVGGLCYVQPIYTYVLGIILGCSGIISYLPQYYNLVKAKHHKGISELSLFLLNLSCVTLAANALILNWWKFKCYQIPLSLGCNFWVCSGNLLSVFQIMVSWAMVLPLYFIFIRYKIRHSDRKIIYDISYISIYVIFILVMIIVGMSEKLLVTNNVNFFYIMAWIMGGLLSPVFSSVVWIPQIVKLIMDKDSGGLSLPMFLMQTPGNGVIIAFQIMYGQNWTTWISYVVTLVEQLIIVIILIFYKYKYRPIQPIVLPSDLDNCYDNVDIYQP